METQNPLLKDEDGIEVDVHMYWSMIGLMYLTTSRPNIMFVVCACARYQVNQKVSHLHAVKMIFRYLKGQQKLGLWYPKDSPFDLVAYTDSDYTRASLDRKSTTRGCQYLGCRLILWQCKKQTVVANSTTEAEYFAALSCCGQVPRSSVPSGNVADEAVYKELDDSLVRVATIASSLEVEQDNGNIIKTRSKVTPNKASSLGTTSGDGLRCQESIGGNMAQTRVDSYDDEPSLGDEDASNYESKIDDIDVDEGITLVDETVENQGSYNDEEMFDASVLDGKDVIVEKEVADKEVSAAAPTDVTSDEITLAEALMEIKTSKPKAKGIVMQEPKKINADYQLAERLQAEEQKELNDEENVTLFIQLLEKRKKFFAAKRAEEKRNRPPTKAQQRSIMCTYLKKIEGWKLINLKNKSFADIQELFDKAMKMVNNFVDYRTELVEESSKKAKEEIAQESSSKRAGEVLEQESSTKQKVEEDKESKELKQCLEIISDDGDDVTIDATPLSTKSPNIVDYKIYKEGKKSYFKIIKADGNSHMYLTFGKMLKNIIREDLEVLWSIVKARFKKTKPVNHRDHFLLLNLKTMFEYHVEDNSILYYLLVEKMYPLTHNTIHQMFNDVKLQVDYEYEMAFYLLRLVKKQLKEGYHLEEIYVTWTQFGKRQTRLKLYMKIDEELVYRSWRWRYNFLVTTLKHSKDDVKTDIDAVKVADSENPKKDSTVQIFYDRVNHATRHIIDQSSGGKLRDKYTDESWALIEDLALYDNGSWNVPRDIGKPVKEISLPQDVPNTSDHCLIEFENKVQCLIEAHLAPKLPFQLNKIASSCKICNAPYDIDYCMKIPVQAFFDYASSRSDKARGKCFTFKHEQNNLGDTYNPSWKSHPNLRWREP
uniref:Uncharacterized mitochondrial protein AtMg00810-like n=1 Tax=Tanacetum cinerariifolium TaxID=118510 RepID=A0A6L2MVS1_TANCI|nr:uncharacterized mitochondrial protein AtMg00810-like [Tanacetum cinerariifolium]